MNLNMKMNILMTLFIGSLSLNAFGQENNQKTVVIPLQTGTITMNGNSAVVPLLKENTDESNVFYTVVLTPIGSSETIFVKSKSSDSFVVESIDNSKNKTKKEIVFDYVIFVPKIIPSPPTKIYQSINDK